MKYTNTKNIKHKAQNVQYELIKKHKMTTGYTYFFYFATSSLVNKRCIYIEINNDRYKSFKTANTEQCEAGMDVASYEADKKCRWSF